METTFVESRSDELLLEFGPPQVPNESSREALHIMQEQQLDFLPVVDAETGRFTGLVKRQALERGCLRMGHQQDCTLYHHIKKNVPTALRTEILEEWWLETTMRERVLVVVDAEHRPTGYVLMR